MLRLILSGLVNWVCLDLEKNMKNEVHVLGWRFLGLMIFLGWFSHVGLGLMIFHVLEDSVEERILYEILHCSGFDCALVLGLIVLGFGKNMKNKFMCSYLLKNNEAIIIIIIIKLDLKVCAFF